ncbi:hypothetical protein QLL95_gp0459 [Cotonvirus japonicus]|uniref:Uncharacterized protein n=1 Tax=Cotonvirus japonicus TaxID=2811091 RepID=A0ABM7NU08_9VIRU|nr:hypothetical protein QLL95_gp0459 [Cotonvirus japonicus]BCS83664.1 hypothetical protein [Cotonvirus japonicus]
MSYHHFIRLNNDLDIHVIRENISTIINNCPESYCFSFPQHRQFLNSVCCSLKNNDINIQAKLFKNRIILISSKNFIREEILDILKQYLSIPMDISTIKSYYQYFDHKTQKCVKQIIE